MLRIYYQCLRNCHTSQSNMSPKALLAKLRGNTGYPFTTCKNALEACNYDLKKVSWKLNVFILLKQKFRCLK